MSTVHRYCSRCGAANSAESQICCACQSPLDTPEEIEQATLLNGRYRLLNQVGAGGFGGVYRAVDSAEGSRVVAVKQIMLRGLSAQEAIEATDGFNREVRLLSTLKHPNLPVIRDAFTDQEHWYLVMDFIEGETLEEYFKRRPGLALPLAEALDLGLQLCTVLNYLHTREPAIIFRDLKPSNVMRTASGRIYLIDFGIARHFTPGKARDTAPFGSPGYAAPEQYGRAQTTPQADIYSLGALLHQVLTGHDPAESPFRFSPLPIADSLELAELDALIQRMVATELAERPASIAEVQTTLQRLADQERRKQLEWLSRSEPPVRPQRRSVPAPAPRGNITRRVVLGTLAAGAVVAGTVGVLCANSRIFGPQFHGTVVEMPPSPGVAKQQFIYRGHTGPITALAWSPDGQYVASGSADKTVQVWRASDGALAYTYYGYTSPVTALAWATDRPHEIASAGQGDGSVQIWDALSDHTYLNWQGDGRVLALAWQEHSPWIVSGGTDGEIYVWNATSGAKGASYAGHKGNVLAVAWLPGMQIAGTGTAIPGLSTPGTGTPAGASNLITSGGADATVQIWDANTGKHLLTFTGHTAGINALAAFSFGPDQSTVAVVSASDDKTVQVWWPDPSLGYATRIYRGHRAKVNAVAILPEVPYYGQRIASASDDQTIQVWEVYRGTPLFTYTGHHAPVKTLASSPVEGDNRVVSGDSRGLVYLWTVTHTGYQ
jgi:serine/threonine protein kinase